MSIIPRRKEEGCEGYL